MDREQSVANLLAVGAGSLQNEAVDHAWLTLLENIASNFMRIGFMTVVPRWRACLVVAVACGWGGLIRGEEPHFGEPAVTAELETYTEDQRDHWAFRPLVRPEVPAVAGSGWMRNPIDAFIQAELEGMELPPAKEADRVALLRRVTFDLTGLPPTLEEQEAFLTDPRPDAYDRLVERLLASPRYGERWAQHWLDLAHYADSNGFELDAERPDAWRYRDWVIRAFNTDLPYDRFAALQIAGDELEPGDPEGLIATGFGRCGPREVVSGNVIPEVRRQNELTEVVGTFGSVFLGLTIACARCHDHKFDPFPSTDYYRLQAFFEAAEYVEVPLASASEREGYEAAKKAVEAKIAPLRKRIAELETPYRKALTERKQAMLSAAERAVLAIPEAQRTTEQQRLAKGLQHSLRITWEEVAEAVAANPSDHQLREQLKREIHEIEQTLPRPTAHAMALIDPSPTAPETYVYRRGDYRNRGPLVTPRPPGVILAANAGDGFAPDWIVPQPKTTGRRLALARWLSSPGNPLFPRVIVNRIWQHHFGRGIVASSSDFGVRGEAPTHPELLDWLACELVASGWRLKPIQRLIVTSAAYRQSHRTTPQALRDDAENSLFGRRERRRRDAEAIRDGMLLASGELNSRMYGPGVKAPLEPEVEALIFTEAEVVDLWEEDRDPAEHLRRSIYLFRKRNIRYPLLESFDAPDNLVACSRRETSTHALQALNLLNSEFAHGRARALAGRILRQAGANQDSALRLAYRILYCREPSPAELARSRRFLAEQAELLRELAQAGQPLARPVGIPAATHDPATAAAWVDLALALLNSNEFLYVP
jgi:hypothetical protein